MKSDQGTKNTLFSLIARYFIQGLFVLLPLTITVVAVVWLVRLLSKQLGPNTFIGSLLKELGIRVAGDSVLAYGIGWGIVMTGVILLGFIVDIGAKKFVKNSIDNIMKRIPVINKVYKVATQIVDMLNKNEQEEFRGMSVVYCTFGGEKGAIFLALMPTPEIFEVRGVPHHIVMIPTAPVPMGGGLMLVPVDSIQPAEMAIDDFMQLYLSMGATSDMLTVRSEK